MWPLLYGLLLVSIGVCFGFILGAIVTKRRPIDTSMVANARRHSFIVGWRAAGRSRPNLVLISPTETRAVKS